MNLTFRINTYRGTAEFAASSPVALLENLLENALPCYSPDCRWSWFELRVKVLPCNWLTVFRGCVAGTPEECGEQMDGAAAMWWEMAQDKYDRAERLEIARQELDIPF